MEQRKSIISGCRATSACCVFPEGKLHPLAVPPVSSIVPYPSIPLPSMGHPVLALSAPGKAPAPPAAAASKVRTVETVLGRAKRKKFATKSLTRMIHASLLQRDVSICQVFHLGLAKDHRPEAPKSRNLTIKALAQGKSNI